MGSVFIEVSFQDEFQIPSFNLPCLKSLWNPSILMDASEIVVFSKHFVAAYLFQF